MAVTTPHHACLLDAFRRVRDLGLPAVGDTPAPQVVASRTLIDRTPMVRLPAVILSFDAVETEELGDFEDDIFGYPVVVTIAVAANQRYEVAEDNDEPALLWRRMIRDCFMDAPAPGANLPGVDGWDVQIEYGPVVHSNLFKEQSVWASQLTLRYKVTERGTANPFDEGPPMRPDQHDDDATTREGKSGEAVTPFTALTITAANVALVSGSKITATAGAAITAGQAVYLDANNALQLAQSDTLAHAACVGVALCNAAAGQPCVYAGASSVVTIGATVVVGTAYVVGTAAGAIAPDADLVAGNYVTQIGRAITAARLQLDLTAYGIAHG